MGHIPCTWSTESIQRQTSLNLTVFSCSGILFDAKLVQFETDAFDSAAGGDILLVTPAGSKVSLIEYRMIGGVLDFYFFSGPTPNSVIEQYGELVGFPAWQPIWGFGFHLCRSFSFVLLCLRPPVICVYRWGYHDLKETKEQVIRMREANIPLEGDPACSLFQVVFTLLFRQLCGTISIFTMQSEISPLIQ